MSGRGRSALGRQATSSDKTLTGDDLLSTDLNKRDGLCVARLEADGGSGSNVEALEEGLAAVEREGAIDFGEVVVRADLSAGVSALDLTTEEDGAETNLNRTVAGIRDLEPDAFSSLVDPDGLLPQNERSRYLLVGRPGWLVRTLGKDALLRQWEERAVKCEREVVVNRDGGDGVVNGDEKDAVGKGAFDLDLVQEGWDGLEE